MSALQQFPRLFEKFRLPTSDDLLQYAEVIEEDDEFQKVKHMCWEEIEYNKQQVDEYIDMWTPFRTLWELDKMTFMQSLSNLTASDFDKNILNYAETANRVQLQESTTSVYFVEVNAIKLKATILLHIDEWKECYKNLLKKNAYEKIQNIYEYTKVNSESILKLPTTIPEMQSAVILYDSLIAELPQKVAEFPEIKQHFEVLGM